MKRCASLVVAFLALAGCTAGGGLGAGTGDSCGSNDDCLSAFCLPFEEGYCSSDCSSMPCAPNELCQVVSGVSACLKPCGAREECRTGYMCFQGACRPSCTGDEECGKGFACADGQCTSLPGKNVGDACAADDECSSRLCDPNTGTCQITCTRDNACPTGQTCYVNPIDKNQDGSTDDIFPICIPKRAGGNALGASCKNDKNCESGQCELGVCTTLCEVSGNCDASTACVGMIAQLDIGAPKIKACLMKSGTLTYDLGANGTGPVGMPTNALSFAIFVEAQGEPITYYAGIGSLEDPTGASLYAPFKDMTEYFALKVRYQPSEGASTVLVPNSPRVPVPIIPGLYTFTTFAASQTMATDLNARVRIKLSETPALTSGKIPLHVFVTDLSGGCRPSFTAANASQALGTFEGEVKKIFGQASMDIGPIVYFDSKAPNTVYIPPTGPSPQLNALLKQATLGDNPDVLELTIIKSITGGSGNILGIAGGIPGSPGIPGTVHSGATISLSAWCFPQNNKDIIFGIVASHEIGHTLGLFHNTEADGSDDALTDTGHGIKSNLMYWEENSGEAVTAQQMQVMLANPQVK